MQSELQESLVESICKCVENAINSNYGNNVGSVVLSLFSKRFGLKKTGIVSHPAKFEELLESMFGTGTACLLVKRTVIKELNRNFQVRNFSDGAKEESVSIASTIKRILCNAS